MKPKFISINGEMAVPIHEADRSGIRYTEEAVVEACKNASGVPITAYNKNGEEVVIGCAESVKYENGHICFNGTLFSGGTMEYIRQTYDLDLVTKCNIAGITFCVQ